MASQRSRHRSVPDIAAFPTSKGTQPVELIIMVLVAFPLGFFLRNRMAAYVAYIAVYSFVFTFQTAELVREWVGGDYSAFPKDPTSAPWPYALVNLVIYSVGLGLVTLGHKQGAKRRRKTLQPVDLGR
jgi:hypothetical protein